MADRVSLTVDDGLAEFRLVRADAHNAIDRRMAEAMREAALQARDDASVRALLITADGPSFTVGGDIGYMAGHADDLSGELRRMITPFHEALAALDELRVPVLTAAQGPIAGGGLGLLYVADTVLLAPDARLVSGFIQLGLSGDGGGTFHLPRLIGRLRAAEFVAQGRTLDAATAVDWGLATRVVDGDLQQAAAGLARELADGPTAAYGAQRELTRTPPAREALAAELATMLRLAEGDGPRAAMTRFAARAR
jgi:2-(1,2-epoxy-1,2-dihydrophenyl)acetyl-CoA isomerase